MDVHIVRAEPRDAPLVAHLFDAYRIFYGQSSDPELAREFLRERLTKQESTVFLALDGPNGVGFTQLYPSFSSVSARRIWILHDLFVAPEARGRGVARALLQAARRLAANTGAKRLTLATAVDNLPAQRLYEKMGWQRNEAFCHYYLGI